MPSEGLHKPGFFLSGLTKHCSESIGYRSTFYPARKLDRWHMPSTGSMKLSNFSESFCQSCKGAQNAYLLERFLCVFCICRLGSGLVLALLGLLCKNKLLEMVQCNESCVSLISIECFASNISLKSIFVLNFRLIMQNVDLRAGLSVAGKISGASSPFRATGSFKSRYFLDLICYFVSSVKVSRCSVYVRNLQINTQHLTSEYSQQATVARKICDAQNRGVTLPSRTNKSPKQRNRSSHKRSCSFRDRNPRTVTTMLTASRNQENTSRRDKQYVANEGFILNPSNSPHLRA